MKITIRDNMLGPVDLDYSVSWSADRPDASKWRAELSGTGRCRLGEIDLRGDGISYEAILYRYGKDMLASHPTYGPTMAKVDYDAAVVKLCAAEYLEARAALAESRKIGVCDDD